MTILFVNIFSSYVFLYLFYEERETSKRTAIIATSSRKEEKTLFSQNVENSNNNITTFMKLYAHISKGYREKGKDE